MNCVWKAAQGLELLEGFAVLPTTNCGPLQGREKIALIAHVTGLGFDVLISDVDTVWLRNPLPYLAMVRVHASVLVFGV